MRVRVLQPCLEASKFTKALGMIIGVGLSIPAQCAPLPVCLSGTVAELVVGWVVVVCVCVCVWGGGGCS